MKKYFLLISILIILVLVGIGVHSYLNQSKATGKKFEIFDILEDKILASLSKPQKNNEYYLLNDLLESGKWREKKVPNNNEQWRKLEEQKDNWAIKKDNRIKISAVDYNAIDGVNFSKQDSFHGFFLIANAGEFGGALYYYPNGNKEKREKIMDGNFIDFFKTSNKIFFFERKWYTMPPEGSIYQIKRGIFGWKPILVEKIGDYPYTSTLVKNTMYLVTNKKLIKLEDNKVKEIIIDNAFWHGLYPNSIVYDNGYAYIGMRAGVAKVNLASKQIQFFAPQK
jgi:hypothetical protein